MKILHYTIELVKAGCLHVNTNFSVPKELTDEISRIPGVSFVYNVGSDVSYAFTVYIGKLFDKEIVIEAVEKCLKNYITPEAQLKENIKITDVYSYYRPKSNLQKVSWISITIIAVAAFLSVKAIRNERAEV